MGCQGQSPRVPWRCFVSNALPRIPDHCNRSWFDEHQPRSRFTVEAGVDGVLDVFENGSASLGEGDHHRPGSLAPPAPRFALVAGSTSFCKVVPLRLSGLIAEARNQQVEVAGLQQGAIDHREESDKLPESTRWPAELLLPKSCMKMPAIDFWDTTGYEMACSQFWI